MGVMKQHSTEGEKGSVRNGAKITQFFYICHGESILFEKHYCPK